MSLPLNYSDIIIVSKHGNITTGGSPPLTLGYFSPFPNIPKGKQITHPNKLLQHVHMDIYYGDCVALGGQRYALTLVYRPTLLTWAYGKRELLGANFIQYLQELCLEAVCLSSKFYMEFDKKMLWVLSHKCLLANGSRNVLFLEWRQSKNGLLELTRRSLLEISWSYLTEWQIAREYWQYVINHSYCMINVCTYKMSCCLPTPHEKVYGVKPDPQYWFLIIYIRYSQY